MKPLLSIFAAVIAMAAVAAAQNIDLPPVPDAHVLDAANSLGDRRRSALAEELARVRRMHGIDIHAVHWDRELPADSDLAALATRLGKSWSREDAWVVVLQLPGENGTIAGAHGGFGAGDNAADTALADGLARGRREWTAPARLAACALECAEEFMFLRAAAAPPPAGATVASIPPAATGDPGGSRIVRLAAACAIVLLLGLAALAWSLRSRRPPEQQPPAPHRFPDTDWNRRFGAPWSGGSDLGATFPDSER